MAITFSGEFTSPRTPDEVYDFLSDPNKFGTAAARFREHVVQDATHFTVKVRVGVGNIRGSAEIKMELAEASRPQRAPTRARARPSAARSQSALASIFSRCAKEHRGSRGKARPVYSASWPPWRAACWSRWARRTSRS